MNFPKAGEIFAGRYRIEEILGSGGFSRVYRATQLDLERPVALKILRPPIHQIDSEHERQKKLDSLSVRFHREAKMISKLRSPHTIIMYDYGRAEESGLLFMSIEYVDGVTLTELVREVGALEPARVIKIIRQVIISLNEAHILQMLHRDLKPQNIMVFDHLGQRDQVKLLDFGIVKLLNDARREQTRDLTDDGTLVGTPRYMAPEYIRGQEIGPNSDIYSLGLVAYELLAGEQAITADSSIQIIGKQLERESFFLPIHLDISNELRNIINRMLHKDPQQRYQNSQEILVDMAAIDHQIATAYRFQGIEDMPDIELLDVEILDEPPVNAATQKKIIAVMALLLLLLLGTAALAIALKDDGDTPGENNLAALTKTPASPVEPPKDPPKSDPDPVEPPPKVEPSTPTPFTISVDNPKADLFLEGKKVGRGKIEVDPSTLTFPLSVRATLGKRTVKRTLESPEDLSLSLPRAPRAKKPTPKTPSCDKPGFRLNPSKTRCLRINPTIAAPKKKLSCPKGQKPNKAKTKCVKRMTVDDVL